jgi:hypothetical protein
MKKEINKDDKSVINYLKRFWNFIWNDDSLLSWIVFIIVVFIAVKFVFFPTLSFITGTTLPLAIVESCSMYHGERFDSWWESEGDWYEKNGIYKNDFESFQFKNGFNKGDIFLILGVDKEDIKLGDIIIFSSGLNRRPIIHRVVDLDDLSTKKDNNAGQFTMTNNPEKINEIGISEQQIIGRVSFVRIPLVGWIKLIFYEPFRDPDERGFCK